MKRMPSLFISIALPVMAALFIAAIFPVAPHALAQTTPATPVPTTTGPQNDVNAFFVACDTSGVMNLRGTMLTGWDVYYQLFTGTAGSGTALSDLRQVSAEGAFTFSEVLPYSNGQTVPAGSSASARVIVARDGNPASVDFEFVVSDVNDGCQSPQNPTGSSTASGSGAASAETGTAAGVAALGNLVSLPLPTGGVLNPNLAPEALVVLGPRLSDAFRSDTPGVIYAACDNFPLAEPGIVYDNDNISVFWSWYTRTEEQMQQHLDNVQYSVRMNTAPFNQVVRSDIQRVGNQFYVFYSVNVGHLRPGHYEIEYRATWANPVNDGYADFGPDTDNPQDAGNCNFNVVRNPNSEFVSYTNMFLPSAGPVHTLFPDPPPTE